MKICQLSYHNSDDFFSGYLERDGEYFEFECSPDDQIHLKQIALSFPFRDYEHFAGVLGKFNPWSRLLADPIPIDDLTHSVLQLVRSESPHIE